MSRTLLMADTGWTPARLTLLRGWYRADMGITLVGADVNAWADQSGIGNHVTAPAAGNRPLYVASDAALGNRPVVEFDGVAEYLKIAAFSFGAVVSSYTFAIVGYDVTWTASGYVWNYGGVGTVRFQQSSVSKLWHVGPGNSIVDVSLTDAIIPALWTCAWTGAVSRLYRGATLEDFDNNNAAAPADGLAFAVGANAVGGNSSNIRVAEAIVTRAALTPSELANLAAYATARYGVA